MRSKAPMDAPIPMPAFASVEREALPPPSTSFAPSLLELPPVSSAPSCSETVTVFASTMLEARELELVEDGASLADTTVPTTLYWPPTKDAQTSGSSGGALKRQPAVSQQSTFFREQQKSRAEPVMCSHGCTRAPCPDISRDSNISQFLKPIGLGKRGL